MVFTKHLKGSYLLYPQQDASGQQTLINTLCTKVAGVGNKSGLICLTFWLKKLPVSPVKSQQGKKSACSGVIQEVL